MTTRHLLRLFLLGAAVAALIGCGKNLPTSVLVPTGYRPGTPPGAISGTVAFDPVRRAENAPYPRVVAELHTFRVGGRGQADSIGAHRAPRSRRHDDRFRVHGRDAGDPHPPVPHRARLRRRRPRPDHRRAGSGAPQPHRASGRGESLALATYVVGTMPGFSIDDAFMNATTAMVQDTLGLWKYPDMLFGYTPIAAGTYRFKFVTDFSSTQDRLIGWGGDSTVTLTAPVTNAPVHYARRAPRRTSRSPFPRPATGRSRSTNAGSPSASRPRARHEGVRGAREDAP